jgi:multidrug efflux pump subunit AcrB
MKKFIEATIRNRRITIFAIVLAFIFGIYSYYFTPKQESPDISVTMALLTTIYPGASTQDVERLVTSKVEDKVMEVEGFSKVNSISQNNLSIVVLELETGSDTDKAWSQLRQKMDELQSDLPKECQEIDINTDLAQTAGMIISLSGPNYSYEELAGYAEELKGDLIDIDGVTRIEVLGKQEREVRISVDTERLNQLPLSLADITGILQAQSIEMPAGSLENTEGKINIRVGGNFSDISEIENTVLLTSKENGSVVRLKDIAQVTYALQDSNYKIKHNDENAVLIAGYFQSSRNIVLIGEEVDARILQYEKSLPENLVFDKVLYQPGNVGNAVNNFVTNLIEGILFVIIVVFVGMGLRNAIIVSTSIPLSILITFIGMRLLDIDINQISIAALIIALGMLVDNAIVVSDAIQVRIDNGQEKLQACAEGAKEVAIPVLTSTLTTVGAFIPLLFLSGMAGEFIRSVPQIVILSLSASYVVAIFVAPALAYIFFKPTKNNREKRGIRLLFEFLLKKGLKRKAAAILMILPVLALAAWMGINLGLQFFPKADTDMIVIDLYHEHANDLQQTEQMTNQVTDILNQQAEVTGHTAAIGDGLPKLYYSMAPAMQAQNYAQVMFKVDLSKSERFKKNEEFADYLQEILDREISQGTATIKLFEQGEPIEAPVRLRVIGERREIAKASEQIKAALKTITGTFNVQDDYSDDTYDYSVKFDSDQGLRMGLTQYDVQKEVNIALMGTSAGYLSLKNKDSQTNQRTQIPVRVVSDIENVNELKTLGIKSSITNNKVMLTQVSEVGLQAAVTKIRKYDRVPSITIHCDVKQGLSSVDIQKQLEEKLKTMDLGDVRIVFDGERESILKYFGNIGFLTILAVFVIYMILLIQFGSFSQPFVIMATIPLSAVGSVLGLYLFKQPLSFTSLLGVVSLFGIVVNNAIVLVDFINTEKAMGKSTEEACIDAVDKRFRPIMLTTITTLVGLVPLIISNSNLFTPMSISLLSGLAVSTLLTLVIVPVVYTIVANRSDRRKVRRAAKQ